MGQILLPNGAAAATPASGYVAIYTKTSDKQLYYKDETGAEVGPLGPTGGALGAANTWTAKQTFTGTMKVQQQLEKVTVTAGAPAATANFDWLTQAVQLYTSNAANNWTLNVRGDSGTTLDSLMAVGESASITVLVTQGATPYYASGFSIDGTGVTPKWIGGAVPSSGDASCINMYTYNIVKTASATFTVIASKNKTS